MKVRELIAVLSTHPPDAHVLLVDPMGRPAPSWIDGGVSAFVHEYTQRGANGDVWLDAKRLPMTYDVGSLEMKP